MQWSKEYGKTMIYEPPLKTGSELLRQTRRLKMPGILLHIILLLSHGAKVLLVGFLTCKLRDHDQFT